MRGLLALTVFGGGIAHATLAPALRIADVAPDIPLIVVVLLALRRGSEFGCIGGFAAGLLQDAAGGGLIGVQALTKALVGFGIGTLGARLRVTQPLVQVPRLVFLSVAEGLVRFALLKLFHFPASFVELKYNGAPLVYNRPTFTLSLIPRELPRDEQGRDAVLGRVAALLRIPYAELAESITRVSLDSFLPVRVRRGLRLEDMAKVEEWKLELPGVIVEVEPQRSYPSSRFAAHLLGYVREASDEQLKQGRYRRGDMVGQSGLERLLDEFLRGRDGGE